MGTELFLVVLMRWFYLLKLKIKKVLKFFIKTKSMTFLKNIKGKSSSSVGLTALLSVLVVTAMVNAATTISTDITTGGALSVTGASTLASTTGTGLFINTGAGYFTSASSTAFSVGLTGNANPAFWVDASTASQVAGLKVTGAATGGTVALVTTDTGSATNLTINAKGTGTIGIGTVSTGAVTITPATTIGGTLGVSGVTTLATTTINGTLVSKRGVSIVPLVGSTTLTTALSDTVYIAASTTQEQTFTLPSALNAGLVFTFIAASAGGAISVVPAGSDTISIKASEGGASVVTAGGIGITNTAATNVVGDHITLVSDGVSQWHMISQSGIWASR